MFEIKELTHIDLFTGIGGFALAAQWNGIRTEVMCEKDERCQFFLKRTYPGILVWDDVKTFDGTKWKGAFLLTGGVPCQPASRAGKQRGKDDDRWLWPEAIRVVNEAKPTWCLFENPPGIGDVGLSGILADLEAQGYEVRVLGIPACAVNAPHQRNRYWILAHNKCIRRITTKPITGTSKCLVGEAITKNESEAANQSHLAHADAEGYQRPDVREERREADGLHPKYRQGDMADTEMRNSTERPECSRRNSLIGSYWDSSVWLPCADGKVRRAPDNAFLLAHGVQSGIHQQVGQGEIATWPSPCSQEVTTPRKGLRKSRIETGRTGGYISEVVGPEAQGLPERTVALGLHRSILAALGNSIVPQVAYYIIQAMLMSEEINV